jgi:hypothetical protein
MVFSAGSLPIRETDGTAIGSLRLETAIAFGAPGASVHPMLLQAVITQPAGIQVSSLMQRNLVSPGDRHNWPSAACVSVST